ncbi:MAG TPA: MerR family transcriptional regulator [Brumimicrobium sp.]|nr:MerR family transcriptional regulator [Brumimicrobium sp.]
MTNKNSEIQNLLTDSGELIRFLTKKQFGLSGIGISDKMAFDWRKAGIYLEEKKSRGRMKYNAIEYVWLRLVTELRAFGLSIEAIKQLKSYLLLSVDFKQMFLDMYEAGVSDDKELDIQNELKRLFISNKELNQLLEEKENELITTVLGMLIYTTIFTQANSYLLIKKDGSCFIHNENPLADSEISLILGGEPYISFPIRFIVSDFIKREDLFELDRYGELFDYDDKEVELLMTIRERELNSLSAKTATEEISLNKSHYMTVEEMDKIRNKLKELFESDIHYEIVYKRDNQKEVSLKK